MTDFEQSDSGNWNMAKSYAALIFQHIYEAKLYKETAIFGTSSLSEEISMYSQGLREEDKIELRFKALERYIFKLMEIINDTKFAISDSNKEKYMEYYSNLIFFRDKSLPLIKIIVPHRDSKKTVLNEELFKAVMSKLDEIDMIIKEPMNRADLIFMYKEQFNPKEYKDKIKQKLIEEA